MVDIFDNLIDGKKIQRQTTSKPQGINLQEAKYIYNVMSDIYFTVRNATKQLGIDEAISNRKSGEMVIEQMRNVKKTAFEPVEKIFLNADRLARKYTGYDANSELYRHIKELNKGSRKKDMFVMKSEKMFAEYVDEHRKEYTDFVGKQIEVKYKDNAGNDKTVKLTKAQALEIIMCWKRELQPNSNLSHLQLGGVTIYDAKALSKGKYIVSQDIHNVNPSLIVALQNEMGEFENGYRAIAEKFFNEVSKDAINETMQVLKHRNVANSKYYIPFAVDRNYVRGEIEGLKYDSTLENKGMLKDTVVDAPQPLLISGLNLTVANHINEVGNIYGLAIPIRNFNKMWNVQMKGRDKSTPIDSVKNRIEKTWGKDSVKFFEQILTDLQTKNKNRATEKEINSLINKVRSNMISTALVGSISVVIKQAASYSTAGVMLSQTFLNKALAKYSAKLAKPSYYKNLCETIDKYTAQHYNRRKGLSMVEVADMNNSIISQKLPTALNPAKWIQGMDCLTTALLWKACEEEIKAKNKNIEINDEFYKQVASLYDDVIENTQPMYDIMHRAEVQKTNNQLIKSVFMFKTQPLQNSGIIYDSLHNAKVNGDIKTLAKALLSQSQSALIFATMTFLASLALHKRKRYTDENDEVTMDSILQQILTDAGGVGINLVLPLGGDIVSNLLGNIESGSSYDVLSDNVVSVVNDFFSAVSDLTTFCNKEIKDAKYREMNKNKLIDALYNVFVSGAGLFKGIPVKNIMNIKDGIVSYLNDITTGTNSFFESDSNSRENKDLAISYGNYYNAGKMDKANEQLKAIYIREKNKQIEKGEDEYSAGKKAMAKVRTTLSYTYKEDYQKACFDNDEAEKNRIMKMLYDSGYMVYEHKTLYTVLKEWEENAEEDLAK